MGLRNSGIDSGESLLSFFILDRFGHSGEVREEILFVSCLRKFSLHEGPLGDSSRE